MTNQDKAFDNLISFRAKLAKHAAGQGNTWGFGDARTHLAEARVDVAEQARDSALARVQSATLRISLQTGSWDELHAAHLELRQHEAELEAATTARHIAWGAFPQRQWARTPARRGL